MSCRIMLSIVCMECLCAELYSSFVTAAEPSVQTTTVCEDNADAACDELADFEFRTREELMRRLRRRNENVMEELAVESDFYFGHPTCRMSYAALPATYLSRVEYEHGILLGWNIETVVDQPSLRSRGIRLDDIDMSELQAGGVSRRSSLRFVLDAAGLSYYVDGKRLVVTTKNMAQVRWLSQLKRPELIGLSASSLKERRDAAFAAGFWRLDPDTWVEPLAHALTDSDREVCFDAAFALGELGPQAERAIDPLVQVLRANALRLRDLTLREGAVYALAKIGPKATKRLLEMIDDPDQSIAFAAAKSLRLMGSAAKEAVPGLIEAGKRRADDEERCDAISSTVAAVDLGDAVPTLRELLKSDKAGIRAFAAETIAAKAAIPGFPGETEELYSALVIAAEPPIEATTVCEDSAQGACAEDTDFEFRNPMELMRRLRRRNENVMEALEVKSELNFRGDSGHPVSYGSFLMYLRAPSDIPYNDGVFGGWNIETVVDQAALRSCGIRLHDIELSALEAGGVSRRSSLRFVLDAAGLSYYVDGKRLVVTTKNMAQAKWLAQLKKPEPEALTASTVKERRDAAFAAGFWRLDPDSWIGPLAHALTDSEREVCFDAAFALGELGPQAERAVDPLAKVLRSKDLTLRDGAVYALAKIGPKATERLLEMVDDPDLSIALAAAKSLRLMGSAGKEALPGLIEAGKRHADDGPRCGSICSAVAAVDLGDAVPTLRELLKSDKEGIRAFAVETISEKARIPGFPGETEELYPLARSCGHELLPLLTDASLRVRVQAAFALSEMDLPSDFPTAELEAAAKDPDRLVSFWAASALRQIKSKQPKPGKGFWKSL